MADPIAHLDWGEPYCDYAATPDCTSIATHALQIHDIDTCNTNTTDKYGNLTFLVCKTCANHATTAAKQLIRALNKHGRANCQSCGAPTITPEHIIRGIKPL